MEVGDSASGVANRGGGSLFLKRGTGESVFQLQGDHTSQPPLEGLRQGTGEENSDRTIVDDPRIQEEQCGFRPGPGPSACTRSSLQAECEAAGMRISTSKSEAMVLDRKRVACPLQVGGEVLPQVEEFKYLGVLFTSEGKMECEIDRRIGAASCSYAVGVPDRRGEEGAESKGEALDLPVNLRSHPHLWS
ncbi:hypothetical protein L3Q82_013807 [Scortum barcoo]|uniref:Uncharacterized protein n=1 Tax=Scortum barcoo TaxID=214431 RepID=A0ACB8VW82_9TELE|nr:hypothetical protein L3Q82_013807 [Scortum barcoo]